MTELYLFTRFHARAGNEKDVEEALLEVLGPSRDEPGCLSIHAFRSVRDPREFYIHSYWRDQAAFDRHAELLHTVRFVQRVQSLIDNELKTTLAQKIG